MIPGGMTSILQPLDVCINKPFKERLEKIWSMWMINDDHIFTKGGKMKRVEIDVICSWIKCAWDDIPEEMIIKSFKKCGITNALDGTEDDII